MSSTQPEQNIGKRASQKSSLWQVDIHYRHCHCYCFSAHIVSHSFYRPAEGERLSRPRHCSKGAQPVPKAVYRSGCRDKHNRPQCNSNLGPRAPQSDALTSRQLGQPGAGLTAAVIPRDLTAFHTCPVLDTECLHNSTTVTFLSLFFAGNKGEVNDGKEEFIWGQIWRQIKIVRRYNGDL